MTSGYYCAIFPFCGGGKKKKKDDKKTKAFYDWATTGIPVTRSPLASKWTIEPGPWTKAFNSSFVPQTSHPLVVDSRGGRGREGGSAFGQF